MYTGFFKGVIQQICPDKEYIEELRGEEMEDFQYVGESRGVKWVDLDFYMQDNKQNVFKYNIRLQDKEKKSKAGALQYINCIGDTQWVSDENDLWSSFKQFEKILSWQKDGKESEKYFQGAKPGKKEVIGNKDYHIAIQGEEDLIHIIKMIQAPNIYDVETNLFLDLQKLFREDFKSLRSIINDDKDFHFTALAYVNENFEQKVFKQFMPLTFIRDVLSETISNFNKTAYNKLINDTEYVPGHYSFGRLIDFNQNNVKTITEDGSDY